LKVLGQKSPQNRAAQNSLISEFRENAKIQLEIKKLEPSKRKLE